MAAIDRIAAILVVVGCVQPTGELDVPAADPTAFRDKVYPILLRDCGFVSCHGARDRFFTVYGPGRTRLDEATGIYDPPTGTELSLSYTRARSMLIAPDGPRGSLLVRKPISRAQGGAGHRGDDVWGAPVYRSTGDQRYLAIYQWATGAAP